MSDRDSNHTLLELQEARAEIDRLRQVTVGQFEGAASLVEQLTKLEKQLIKAKKTVQALNAENDALLAALEQSTDELVKLVKENQNLKQGWQDGWYGYLPKATLIYADGKPLIHISNIPGEKTARVYEPGNTLHLPNKTWANTEMISQLQAIWENLGIRKKPLPGKGGSDVATKYFRA